jgi:uncharacterized protein YcfJ
MNKSLITGVVAGAVVLAAGGAYAIKLSGPSYAQVVGVEPVQKTIRTPRQECHDEIVQPSSARRPKPGIDPRTVPQTVKRCVTVYDTHIERSGYEVRYRIGDTEGTIRMDHDPGDRIPLRQGKLVLDAHTGTG